MGFSSSNCKVCSHPMLSLYAVNDINKWMNHCVVIDQKDIVSKGYYDGYARLLSANMTSVVNYDEEVEKVTVKNMQVDQEVSSYHYDCWKTTGCPDKYLGTSEPANCQGYFFGNEHDIKSPLDK